MYICVKEAQPLNKSVEKTDSSKETDVYIDINRDMLQRRVKSN